RSPGPQSTAPPTRRYASDYSLATRDWPAVRRRVAGVGAPSERLDEASTRVESGPCPPAAEERSEEDAPTPADRRCGRALPGPAEDEVVARLPAPSVCGADEDVVGHAPQVVDHVHVDEARQAGVVRLHRGPGRAPLRRHLAVVDRRP